MPSLSRITVFPIKSLDGHDAAASKVLGCGALAEDRRYALVDQWAKYVNGKNCAAIHRIRARYTDDLREVTLSCDGQQRQFSLEREQTELADWCGEVLEMKCRLIENADGGFPDDSESPGPTLISTASLQAVAEWFDGLDLVEVRRRFRFNLEVADVPEFWEDGLVGESQTVRRFRIGDLVWQGSGVCQRCVVPTRDSQDGSVTTSFAREFGRRRELSLPEFAPRSRFDHFYRLGANMRLDACDANDELRVGDLIELHS